VAPQAAYALVGINLIERNAALLQGCGHRQPNGPCADDEQSIGSQRSAAHTCPSYFRYVWNLD
jgi:hypothetical protein